MRVVMAVIYPIGAAAAAKVSIGGSSIIAPVRSATRAKPRLAHHCFKPIDDSDHAGGIAEGQIADHHRSGAGQHIFHRVLDLDDAAAADDRDFHRLGALMHHAHDDRLDARSRQAAELVADRRAERVGVDLQSQDRIGHDQRVGARALGCLRDRDDIAGIGRQLHPDWFFGGGADEPDHVISELGMQREIAAFGIARRAGNIDLEHVDVALGDVARHGFEILDRGRRDRADQRRREAPIVRHLVLEEIFDALGRQADRIDHAAFHFGGARRRIAGAVFARHGLRHHGAEPVDVHHLGEIGREAAGAGHDRILQRHRADLDAHIYHPTASCMSNTGPSMQTRRSSFLPLTSKVRTQT